MRCTRAQRWLSRELDGELSPAQAAALRQHVAQCWSCQEVARSLRGVGDALDALPAMEARPDFVMRTLARLDAVPQPSKWTRLAPWPLRVAAAAAAFIGGVWAASDVAAPAPSADENATAGARSDAALLADWFTAAPDESVAGRYLDFIPGEEG